MRKAFFDTMLEIGLKDDRLVVLIGDISHFGLQPFAKACPNRFYNIGILEPTIVSMSAGLALSGLYPVAHTIAPFLIERSFEQIKLDFCYQNLGGNLISVGSAFDYSGLGCSHHCYDDFALLKSLPNTEIIYPASNKEFNILFKATYRDSKLTYFRLTGEKHEIDIPDDKIVFGQGILIKEGSDVTIVATGPHLKTVMHSLSTLKDNKIDAEVLYYPTVKPFDEKCLIKSLKKTSKVLVIEEHSMFGGLCDDVLRTSAILPNVKYSFINIPNEFQRKYGKYEEHLYSLGFSISNIVEKIINLF